MGIGYIYNCKKCENRQVFLLGCGIFTYSENLLFDLRKKPGRLLAFCHDDEERTIVKKLIESKKYHLVEGHEYKICKCDKCGEFYNKYTFELFSREYNNGYISKAICENCNTDLRIIKKEDIDKENFPGNCKKCGNTEFDIEYINWD